MEHTKVTILMVVARLLEEGMNILIKAATAKGMSDYVFMVYSNATAFSLLLACSFLYYRDRPSPSITISIYFRIFLHSVLICAARTLLYTGIGYRSPVLASVMSDLSPAFTFLLAIIFGYEKVEVTQLSSHAKCIGTVLSVTGALMVTVSRGEANGEDSKLEDGWLLGGILLALGTFCVSVIFNVKTWIMKGYPEAVMVATISCGFVAVLSAAVALIAERNNAQAWTLRPDMEMVAILFSGIFGKSMRHITHTWACGRKGPVYAAMFTPLGTIFAVALGLVFLGQSLSLGSVIGGGVTTIGFYGVLWGQAQQEKTASETEENGGDAASSSCNDAESPLLQNQGV